MAQVFLVDDDSDLRETYADILTTVGHEVRVAGTGTEALKLLTTYTPEIVILDMQLPSGSGTLVLAFIRRHPHFAATKVIIVSGFVQRAKFAAKDWGADGWMSKPVSPEVLRKVVTDALAGHLSIDPADQAHRD